MSARTAITIQGVTPLEADVLRVMMDAHPDQARLIEDQLGRASIRSRRLTGVGFFLNLAVAPGERFEASAFELNDVYATMDGLEAGAGFLLFIRNGVIDFLEGYSFDEPWPEIEQGYRVFIQSPDRGPVH